jgi:hypothetical protein
MERCVPSLCGVDWTSRGDRRRLTPGLIASLQIVGAVIPIVGAILALIRAQDTGGARDNTPTALVTALAWRHSGPDEWSHKDPIGRRRRLHARTVELRLALVIIAIYFIGYVVLVSTVVYLGKAFLLLASLYALVAVPSCVLYAINLTPGRVRSNAFSRNVAAAELMLEGDAATTLAEVQRSLIRRSKLWIFERDPDAGRVVMVVARARWRWPLPIGEYIAIIADRAPANRCHLVILSDTDFPLIWDLGCCTATIDRLISGLVTSGSVQGATS